MSESNDTDTELESLAAGISRLKACTYDMHGERYLFRTLSGPMLASRDAVIELGRRILARTEARALGFLEVVEDPFQEWIGASDVYPC